MAKTKTPFLSMGSSGTVGGSLTSQRRGRATLLREKPVPTDPYSLAQAYQRWLYEDYVYLWHQQSVATKQTYASAGVRFHLTAFQYWMKYHLANLPDILGWWPLDVSYSGITPDFSKNKNHATVFGAYPVDGLIDHSFYFDGVNDRLDAGGSPTLISTTGSIELFVKPFVTGVTYDLLVMNQDANNRLFIRKLATNKIDFFILVAGAYPMDIVTIGTIDANWRHLVITQDGIKARIYIDTILQALAPETNGPTWTSHLTALANTWIGGVAGSYTKGRIDNVIIYNEPLDQTTITRHFSRRYPT